MTRVFVFTNHKGGIGKSTSATNAAYGIATMLKKAGASNSRVKNRTRFLVELPVPKRRTHRGQVFRIRCRRKIQPISCGIQDTEIGSRMKNFTITI